MKFRKKPVVIEAVHYVGGGNVEPRGAVPDWLWDAFGSGIARYSKGIEPLLLRTLEGDLTVSPGDWIIRGVKGELYACKPDIFELTYEPADLPSEASAAVRPDFNPNYTQCPECGGTFEHYAPCQFAALPVTPTQEPQ